jgi:hypothetical protein
MSWFNRLMMSDVGIKVAAREFVEGIASRVREFERFMPAGSDSVLGSIFLKAQVRSLIEDSPLTRSRTRSGAPFLFCSRWRVEGLQCSPQHRLHPRLAGILPHPCKGERAGVGALCSLSRELLSKPHFPAVEAMVADLWRVVEMGAVKLLRAVVPP